MAAGSYEQPGDKPPEEKEEDKVQDSEIPIANWVEDLDAPNLVTFFKASEEGRKWLGDVLAKQACDDTQQWWDDSEEYRRNRAKINRLYTGFLKKKTFPHEHCANAHVPLVLEDVSRLASNIYAEIFQDRDMIFGVKATGPDDYETAEILTVHGNWRLRHELTDFLGQMDMAVVEFLLAGSVVAYSWRDMKGERNRHDILVIGKDVVLPYVDRTTMVDLSDLPGITRFVRKYRNELEDMRDSGEWENIDHVLKEETPPEADFMDNIIREQGEQREGMRSSDNPKHRPWVFFEYHGWVRMPGETHVRPVKATVSAVKKIVVHLQIREEPDWKDQMRFDRQSNELAQFQTDTQAFPQVQAEYEMALQQPPMPEMDPMSGQPMPPPPPPEPPMPPTPPQWAQADEAGMYQPPEPVRRVTLNMFSHGRCTYNPNGMLGLGFGDVLAPFNKLNDEALNRFYDQATANNSPGWLTLGNLLVGNKALVPNQVTAVQNAGVDDIRKLLIDLRPGPANPQLLEVVRYGDEKAEAAIAAPGVLSGQPGKSGETFRGLATRAEKATKQLTTAGVKFLAFLDQILKNDAKLLARFMDDEELVQVNDHLQDYRKFTREQGELRITRDMYLRNYEVSFTADVRFTSQAQKIAEADEILAMVNQVFPPPPPGAPFPDTMAALRYAAVMKAFRARGMQDLIPLLGPPPPVPEMPMGTPMLPPPPPPGMGPPPGAPPGPPGPGGPQPGPPPPAGPPS
jgi:hypothetical protein